MPVAEHESLVTQVKKLSGKESQCDADVGDRLSDLSYADPPRTSSGLSFHGGTSPIPIPIPAPASLVPGTSVRLPSLPEGSSDKENNTPGTQCQGHSSLDAPSELNPPQRIPGPLLYAPLVPQAEG